MITTLSGSNGYMLNQALQDSLRIFKDRYGDLSIERIDATETDHQAIADSLLNLPFLSPSKLVILYSPSTNKQFNEQAEKLLADMPTTTELIIIEPNVDRRSKYYKLLKELTEFKDFSELDTGQVAKWILKFVADKDGKINTTDANYLIDTVGVNQLRLNNEINKLLSYQPEITRSNIDLLVEPTPQTTIFQLLDAAFFGRREELLRIYEDQRKQKVEPQQIIAMLTWQLNNLVLIKAAGNISPKEISEKTKLNPFVVNKSLSITRKFSFEYIKSLISDLLDLDIRLKSQSIDPNDAVIQFLLSIEQQ